MQPVRSPFELGHVPRPRWYHQFWFGSIWHRYLESLKSQLAERGRVGEEVWQGSKRIVVARIIESILSDYCWGEEFRFHPDDPYRVIGEWEVGDLSEIEALMEMESQFGINLQEGIFDLVSRNGTFGEVVNLVLKMQNARTAVSD